MSILFILAVSTMFTFLDPLHNPEAGKIEETRERPEDKLRKGEKVEEIFND
jgi:hypothetical protein